tara:strand:+ start:347 stop:637 length:291 start_codon:yes stop_codon:yes gene_type:complete
MISYFIEFIGTFIFLSVTIITKNPYAIGLALTTAILFGSKISNTYFNPALSLIMAMDNKISYLEFFRQTIVQMLAAVSAFVYYKIVKSNNKQLWRR